MGCGRVLGCVVHRYVASLLGQGTCAGVVGGFVVVGGVDWSGVWDE